MKLLLAILVTLPAMADSMAIEFTATRDVIEGSGNQPRGPLNFFGSFVTDGICQICTISETDNVVTGEGGLLSLLVTQSENLADVRFGLGDFPGAEWNLVSGTASYNAAANTLSAHLDDCCAEFM